MRWVAVLLSFTTANCAASKRSVRRRCSARENQKNCIGWRYTGGNLSPDDHSSPSGLVSATGARGTGRRLYLHIATEAEHWLRRTTWGFREEYWSELGIGIARPPSVENLIEARECGCEGVRGE